MILVSFDIDGTLETGDPPGPISIEMVREAKARGHVIGSASDRTVAFQRRMWEEHEVEVDFVGHKHHLADIISKFECSRLLHIGDTTVDEHYARLAGLEFFFADKIPDAGAAGWVF
ncbi:MAG: HAD family hydrolase [Acidobacteria bacterium]|nr:HAD family hydrolase [Acidobacteriota bacterium]